MKRVVIIDNYDSFTYNLVQLVAACDNQAHIEVLRNDKITAGGLAAYRPTHLIFSPGPGRPENAGNSNEIIAAWAGKAAILGVCRGHQCIAQVFNGRVGRAGRCMHGKTSLIYHDGQTIFTELANPFVAMRYHSLIVDRHGLPAEMVISAWTDTNEGMALRHRSMESEAVQFHPESFATAEGSVLMSNFLRRSVTSHTMVDQNRQSPT